MKTESKKDVLICEDDPVPQGRRAEAAFDRSQAGEQIRLMSEANGVTRESYEGHLREMRRQSRGPGPHSPLPVRMPAIKPVPER